MSNEKLSAVSVFILIVLHLFYINRYFEYELLL